MALQGNFIKITTSNSETEVTTTTISYPQNLSEGDWNYDLRGTTEIIESPVIIKEKEILADTYVMITGLSIEKVITEYNISYAYRVYNSEKERKEDFESHVHIGVDTFSWDNSSDVNPLIRAYEQLKNLDECINLTNV